MKQRPKKRKIGGGKTRIKGTRKVAERRRSFNQLLQFPMLTTLLTSSPRRPKSRNRCSQSTEFIISNPHPSFLNRRHVSCVCYLHPLAKSSSSPRSPWQFSHPKIHRLEKSPPLPSLQIHTKDSTTSGIPLEGSRITYSQRRKELVKRASKRNEAEQ